MITGSMAFQCYQGKRGSTTKASCPSGWCMKGTPTSGDDAYLCDPLGICALMGEKCQEDSTDKDYKSMCCCNGNLCNSATLHTQHIWLGVISFIVSMMLLA
uniref:Activin types I and II receptor domain-containing protein n=1 Tax=Plectus sambesii TaxID=2011161 RepID=A0A914XAA9_9BILA